MVVFWITQNIAQVPSDPHWLHPSEKKVYNALKFDKRKQDYLLGRWTAKQAIIEFKQRKSQHLNIRDIEIAKAEDGAPEPFYMSKELDCEISLSHSHGIGMCTITGRGAKVGCDIEKIEPRSKNFINDYFTEGEQMYIKVQGKKSNPLHSNLIWSAKESVLKALKTGLSINTRKIQINLEKLEQQDDWQFFDVELFSKGDSFYGKWKHNSGLVYTVVCDQSDFQLEQLF